MIRFLKCCFLFVRYITRVRAHRPATVRCILSASVLDLFSVCFVFVFYLFFICSSTCFILVHGLFPICHFRSFIRSPLVAPPFCFASCTLCTSFIFRLLFIHLSFVVHLFATCRQLVPHLFRSVSACSPICFPLALHSFCFHLFVICLFPIRSTFILHLFPVLPLSIIVCFLFFCEAECGAPTPVKAHHRVSRACVRVYVCVSRDRFSARNFPEARIDVKAKRRVSRKDSRVRLGSEVRRA